MWVGRRGRSGNYCGPGYGYGTYYDVFFYEATKDYTLVGGEVVYVRGALIEEGDSYGSFSITEDRVEWGWSQPAATGGGDEVSARFHFPD